MATAVGKETIFAESSKQDNKMVDLVKKEEEVIASRWAVLKDRENRAKRFISILLNLFDTYSPTDLLVYEVGIYLLSDEVYECYVAFGLEEGENSFDVADLQSDEFFVKLDSSDALIKQMNEVNKQIKDLNARIIDLAYDYLKKDPLKNFEVSRTEDKVFVLKINKIAICK